MVPTESLQLLLGLLRRVRGGGIVDDRRHGAVQALAVKVHLCCSVIFLADEHSCLL